ncbi:hypothetical protein TcasGA2_TC032842 [Tribolium castaneum]|uniref:Uncharacterized protein n=1 Tax=Tribolium castaneum TaxID=7070 RepID=A0A139WJ34_TRICA|nr:hypothetical protein TcasGA2_TC032842 [Tribolium castaneum]
MGPPILQENTNPNSAKVHALPRSLDYHSFSPRKKFIFNASVRLILILAMIVVFSAVTISVQPPFGLKLIYLHLIGLFVLQFFTTVYFFYKGWKNGLPVHLCKIWFTIEIVYLVLIIVAMAVLFSTISSPNIWIIILEIKIIFILGVTCYYNVRKLQQLQKSPYEVQPN